MTNNRFISRNESFGKTLFDKDTLSYSFLSHSQHDKFIQEHPDTLQINNTVNHLKDILTAPVKMYYDLTSECNLRCKTCHNTSGYAMDGELSTEEAINTIDGLFRDGVFYIKFSGGEITQREDWFDILSHAKGLGMAVGMNTNGIYAPDTLDQIIELSPQDINISLDGTQRINDKIRGYGSFDKAFSSIKTLLEANQPVSINSVISAQTTEEDILNLILLSEDYVFPVDFFHCRPMGRALKHDNIVPTYDHVHHIQTLVRDLQGRKNKPQLSVYEHMSDGFTVFNIIPNGDIYAGGCVPHVSIQERPNLVLGNIVQEGYSISNIWARSTRLNDIRFDYKSYQDRCNGCQEYNTRCDGFTPEMEVYRKVTSTNPFCKE